jgi:hypothetical protein
MWRCRLATGRNKATDAIEPAMNTINWTVIPVEEARLREVFHGHYDQYRTLVRRWKLPRFSRSQAGWQRNAKSKRVRQKMFSCARNSRLVLKSFMRPRARQSYFRMGAMVNVLQVLFMIGARARVCE